MLLTTSILILRWVSFLLACWNTTWTYRGTVDLMRWRFSPPAIYLSVVFWFALANLSFWASWMWNPPRHPEPTTEAWRLLAYLLLTASQGLAAYGNRLGSALKARKFYGLYDHLEVAFAISELARVDQPGAAVVADECRQRAAFIMLERAS